MTSELSFRFENLHHVGGECRAGRSKLQTGHKGYDLVTVLSEVSPQS